MQMLQEPVYRRTTATEIARIDYAAFAQSVGLAFNQIASNADVLPGLQRALATPGPVLTQVIVSYEGREMRWLGALAVAVHQEAAQQPEGPPGDADRRPDRCLASPTTID